jgi:UDP-N-acetylglucosamine 4,6-dehydratase
MDMLDGKTLLITGGTGSFGNAVLRRFINTSIAEIRIFSRDEKKQDDMRIALQSDKVKFYVGDVRDAQSIHPAMSNVDYVFHAAALKQVPSCEFYPMEAVKTNILGADNVISAAIEAGAKKVIVLSTDKAVYPINAMGMTKGMMEKIMVSRSRTVSQKETVLCATRYGNVIASRGSVIPLFMKQIREGLDITVTDPDMTRFLMSLSDAVDLVMYAFMNAMQGDIFVQKAPAATISVLAQATTELARAKAKIRIIGTRHGEKLYETLLTREEMGRAEDLGRYYRIPSDNRDLNYGKYFEDGETSLSHLNDYNSHNTERLGIDQVCTMLAGVKEVQELLDL